mgnify:FL=1|tara:strand:- start:717 stop:1259 length:543 start_codon:yes stop_codon:yes gene_type:complete
MSKRVILGRAGDGSEYGLFVSKAGTDVIDGNDDIAASNNLLFDSRRAETGGNVLASGTASFTFSGTNTTATSADTYFIGNSSSHTTFDYVPLMLFARVQGNNVYSFNSFHTFFTSVSNPNIEGDPAASQGFEQDVYAVINKNKFVLKARRFIYGGSTYGLTNGTYTYNWVALAVGEASTG